MNYAFLPDLFALAMLVLILVMVRQEHSEERSNAWLFGLFITLVESVAHTFYAPNALPARALHLLVLDCYTIAGLVFVWASSHPGHSRRSRVLLIALNGVPLLALATPYGLNIRTPDVYVPAIVLGAVFGIAGSQLVCRRWLYAGMQLAGWTAVALLVSQGLYRNAVYWALGCLYTVAALNFQQQLKRRSTGKLAIITGFSIWALFFFLHPWTVSHGAWTDIASHMWNLQKSLISLGMILVMLEEHASSNAYLAHHDELTGLANRRMFASRLTLAIDRLDRRAGSLAVVVLDLDNFKRINDTLGHSTGDQVLREVALSIRSNVRSTDTVARMGGDEFIILAEGVSGESSVRRLAEAIQGAVQRPIVFQGQTMHISASVGIAMYPEDSRDAMKLLRIADQRMYHRKKMPLPVPHLDRTFATFPPA